LSALFYQNGSANKKLSKLRISKGTFGGALAPAPTEAGQTANERTAPGARALFQLDALLVHGCTRECATLGASTTVRQDAEDMDGAGRQPRPGRVWRRRAARRLGCGRRGRTAPQPG